GFREVPCPCGRPVRRERLTHPHRRAAHPGPRLPAVRPVQVLLGPGGHHARPRAQRGPARAPGGPRRGPRAAARRRRQQAVRAHRRHAGGGGPPQRLGGRRRERLRPRRGRRERLRHRRPRARQQPAQAREARRHGDARGRRPSAAPWSVTGSGCTRTATASLSATGRSTV
ncbi:hypothetical protein CFC21_105803, partial [Triticum aestivum]